MLGVEHDYHPNLEVFVSAGCIPQEDCTPIHVGGLGGSGVSGSSVWVSGAEPLKLKHM